MKPPPGSAAGYRRYPAAVVEEHCARRLRKFRTQLAAQVARWGGKQAPSCDGLCEIILDGPA